MTDEQTSYSMIDPAGCDVPRTLDELPMGASAVITSVDCDSNQLRQHIFDMGLTPVSYTHLTLPTILRV